jgi:hypothetical protein
MVGQSWLQTGRLHAFAPARQAQASAVGGFGHPVALQPPFQNVSVVADDAAAQPRLAEAITDLNLMLPQFASDYAPPPSVPWMVHLATEESVARQTMAQDLHVPQQSLDRSFTQSTNARGGARQPSGIASLIYLPDTVGIHAPLGFLAGHYYLSALVRGPGGACPPSLVGGGAEPCPYWLSGGAGGPYPYWFFRGFALHTQGRFGGGGPYYHQTAVNDVQAGTAPPLASIAAQADASAFVAAAPGNQARLDARCTAAVDYLARKYGEAALGRLARPDTAAAFGDQLQQITGMGLDGLDAAITASLQ